MTTPAPNSSLKVRTFSAIILGPSVLFVLYLGGVPFTLMMAAAAVISIQEWGKMVSLDKNYRIPLIIFGLLYIGISIATIIWLRTGIEDGLFHVLTLLFIVWASDIAAYFTGRTFGGPKLAPKISPKKTWSGFFGSSVGAALVAGLMAHPLIAAKFDVITIGNLSWVCYAALGFVLGMFGQAGDLFISIFKRRYGVKDTGTLIPGHGGILDRIDALLLVTLVFGALAFFLR